MRGNGSQPTDHRHTGQPTGVFSTVGAEPRSSWTTPGATVIPNPSVDPRLRSWVDPDVVPGVLGPPRPNPTSHGDVAMPGPVEASADQGSEQGVGSAPPTRPSHGQWARGRRSNPSAGTDRPDGFESRPPRPPGRSAGSRGAPGTSGRSPWRPDVFGRRPRYRRNRVGCSSASNADEVNSGSRNESMVAAVTLGITRLGPHGPRMEAISRV